MVFVVVCYRGGEEKRFKCTSPLPGGYLTFANNGHSIRHEAPSAYHDGSVQSCKAS